MAGLGDGFDRSGLERISRRSDPGGRLARAVLELAVRIRGPEQQLLGELDALHRQIDSNPDGG